MCKREKCMYKWKLYRRLPFLIPLISGTCKCKKCIYKFIMVVNDRDNSQVTICFLFLLINSVAYFLKKLTSDNSQLVPAPLEQLLVVLGLAGADRLDDGAGAVNFCPKHSQACFPINKDRRSILRRPLSTLAKPGGQQGQCPPQPNN